MGSIDPHARHGICIDHAQNPNSLPKCRQLKYKYVIYLIYHIHISQHINMEHTGDPNGPKTGRNKELTGIEGAHCEDGSKFKEPYFAHHCRITPANFYRELTGILHVLDIG